MPGLPGIRVFDVIEATQKIKGAMGILDLKWDAT